MGDSPGQCRIVVTGEVDMYTGPALRNRILTRIHRGGPDLIVDLTEVRFFGAAGISVLLAAQEKAVGAGVGLCVVACSHFILRPITITGVDALLNLQPDVEHAIDALRRTRRFGTHWASPYTSGV